MDEARLNRSEMGEKIILMSYSHPVEEFNFPNDVSRYRTIRNLNHFREMINNENSLARRKITFEPTLITGSDGVETLNLNCKQCDAYFRFVCLKKGERFTQNGYNHRHQHVLKQTHTFEQSIIQRINKFLQQEDNKQELHELRAEIEVTYRLPSKEFDQLYSQALTRLKNNSQLYDGKEIDQLAKKLKTERYTILGDYQPSKLERENRTITRSMLILNDQMTTNYKKYGESCFLTVEDRQDVNRWYVGALMGIGRDMELTLFGVFLMKTVDSDHIKGMLKAFFSEADNKPQVILTQNNYYYDQALLELNEEGFFSVKHLYDYATFAERLHRNNPRLRKTLSLLAKESQTRKFMDMLQENYNLDNFNEISFDLQELVSQSHMFCLSQIGSFPVGPYRSIRTKANKKTDFSIIRNFHRILSEKECQLGKHLYSKIKSILNYLSIPPNDEPADKNRAMEIFPELQALRPEVSRNVMEYIMGKVYASLQLRCKKVNKNSYRVFEQRNFVLVVKMNQKWVCECKESAKTMLPCVHEVLVCNKSHSPFSIQLGKRWTNEDQKLEEELRRKLWKRPRTKRITLSEFLA